jgi:predicted amidohydrolase
VAGVNRIGEDGQGINHCGDTMLIDPLGEVIADAGDREQDLTITLEKEKLTEIRQKFPFWKDADPFLLLPDTPQG